MISVTKLRAGVTFKYRGEPWRVLEYKHVHLSRGSGTIRVKVRNLIGDQAKSITFKSGDRVDEVEIENKKLTYLYKDGDLFVFMDPGNFSQENVENKVISKASKYLIEGNLYNILYYEGKAVDIEIPKKIRLKVVRSAPGVKGDTVSGATKEAFLENGERVKVPLFIKNGDELIINTDTGEYVERAK